MALTTEQIELAKELIPDIEVTAETTTEQLKALMGEKFIDLKLHEEEKKKAADTAFVSGRAKAENAMKRMLGDEGKGKTFDELIGVLETHVEEKARKIKELESGKGKGGEDVEALKREKAQLDEMLKEANKKIDELSLEVDNAKTEGLSLLNQHKLTESVTREFESISWTDNTNEYTKVGLWKTEVEGKYSFKLEDEFVYDQEGNVVKDPKGTGKLTRKSLFESIADKAGALQKNGAQTHKKDEKRKTENLTPREEKYFSQLSELKAAMAPKK